MHRQVSFVPDGVNLSIQIGKLKLQNPVMVASGPFGYGVGVSLTCVIPVRTADGWKYRRNRNEGPKFDSLQIEWEVASCP